MNPDIVNQINNQSSDFTTSLRNETRQLLDMLSNEYNATNLADVLHGAWITLDAPNNNPDFLPQVAHSIREFIEKAHDHLVEAPVKKDGNGLKDAVISLEGKWSSATQNTKSINISDWSGTVDSPFQMILKALGDFFATFSAERRPRSGQFKAVINKLDGSSQAVPAITEKERLKLWGELDDFFIGVAHHQINTNKEKLTAKIVALEDFILDLKYPERLVPIELLDTLDGLIAEGESQ